MSKKKSVPREFSRLETEVDQRRTYRIPVSLLFQFAGRHRLGKTGAGLMADLSETGCRVHSLQPLRIGSTLALVAELPHPLLITEARVAWLEGEWSGLEFLRVSPSELTCLRHFLWKNISRAVVSGQRPLFSLVNNTSTNRRWLKVIS